MTAGTSALTICQRALADIGTRSTITSVFPSDTTTEANYAGLYYNGVRDHILRAANWNFAKRTANLQLWKALPGTPENPTLATVSGWTNAYPCPPWVYSYIYPPDALRARSLIGQPQQVPIAPPIFSGSQGTNPPISQRLPMARFEVAADLYDQVGQLVAQTFGLFGPLTIVVPGVGYAPGDLVTLSGGPFGIPAVIQVTRVSAPALPFITTVGGFQLQTTQGGALLATPGSQAIGGVVAANVLTPGTYANPPMGNLNQTATTGAGAGLVVSGVTGLNQSPQTVILTNQEFALLDYTFMADNELTWDPMFDEAMIAAMAGRLAQALTGDKALARDKYALANEHILNARAIDANEGLTINDHMPDWIRTRGAGGGLGYEQFFYPIGPLFPVAPLV